MNEEKSMILYTEGSQFDEVGIIVGGGGVEILVVGGWGYEKLAAYNGAVLENSHHDTLPIFHLFPPFFFFYIFVLSFLEFLFH